MYAAAAAAAAAPQVDILQSTFCCCLEAKRLPFNGSVSYLVLPCAKAHLAAGNA
jgi:hypothetical protein